MENPMNDRDLTNRLEQMPRPVIAADAMKDSLKLTLVSVRGSSRWGAALIALPALFVFGVVLHYGFGLAVPGFAALEDSLTWLESQRWGSLLAALLLVGAPLTALVLNLLALSHIQIDRRRRELQFTLRLRPLNIVIAFVAVLIVALVAVHIIAEQAHHLP
jgi:heme/copper-type cytochrome/quinol oxidase subunit 2